MVPVEALAVVPVEKLLQVTDRLRLDSLKLLSEADDCSLAVLKLLSVLAVLWSLAVLRDDPELSVLWSLIELSVESLLSVLWSLTELPVESLLSVLWSLTVDWLL